MANEPKFDMYAWGERRQRPASARTGLSYQDFQSMQTFQRKQSGERRLPTPLWAINDALFRKLLVTFMEGRLGLRPGKGTIIDRLDRARLAALAQHPRLNETIDRLNLEYVQVQRGGVTDAEVERRTIQPPLPSFEDETKVQAARERLVELEVEIEGIDTYLRYTRNGGAGVLAQVVYLYYRVGLDSVGVADETGLKPPHVRQLLYRLNEVWKEKFSEANPGPKIFRPEPLFDLYDPTKS